LQLVIVTPSSSLGVFHDVHLNPWWTPSLPTPSAFSRRVRQPLTLQQRLGIVMCNAASKASATFVAWIARRAHPRDLRALGSVGLASIISRASRKISADSSGSSTALDSVSAPTIVESIRIDSLR